MLREFTLRGVHDERVPLIKSITKLSAAIIQRRGGRYACRQGSKAVSSEDVSARRTNQVPAIRTRAARLPTRRCDRRRARATTLPDGSPPQCVANFRARYDRRPGRESAEQGRWFSGRLRSKMSYADLFHTASVSRPDPTRPPVPPATGLPTAARALRVHAR